MTLKKDKDYLVVAETEKKQYQAFANLRLFDSRGLCNTAQFICRCDPEKRIVLEPAGTIGERKQQALEFLVKNGEIGFQSVITSRWNS